MSPRLAWFAFLYLCGLALSLLLNTLFDPPIWVVFLSCVALGIAIPTPEWARYKPKSAPEPEVCEFCVDGRHIHDVNGGHCVTAWCNCEEATR